MIDNRLKRLKKFTQYFDLGLDGIGLKSFP